MTPTAGLPQLSLAGSAPITGGNMATRRRESRETASRTAPESHGAAASKTAAPNDTAQPRETAGPFQGQSDNWWRVIAVGVVASVLYVIYTEVRDLGKEHQRTHLELRDRIAEVTASAKDALHRLDKQQAKFNIKIEQKLDGLEKQITEKKIAKRP